MRAYSNTPHLDRYAVRVVDRGLDLLELLRDAGRPLGLQQISERLGIVKSSAFRLLCTLERRGYVDRAESGAGYRLGVQWLSFRGASSSRAPLSELALPHMQHLRDAFGETVNLGVLNDGEVLYLEMLESHHPFRMAARVGARSPVHSTGLGKAICAFLPEHSLGPLIEARGLPAVTSRTITTPSAWNRELARTRARGYAEDNAETEPEASCVAAPIFVADGSVAAAISISGPTSRIRAMKAGAIPALMDACKVISQGLGYEGAVSAHQEEVRDLTVVSASKPLRNSTREPLRNATKEGRE